MPIFFLLSGFCLTLRYGSEKFTSKTRGHFNYWTFLGARLARIMPVYLICYFAALPLYFLGFSSHDPFTALSIIGAILPLFLVQSWVLVFNLGPNGPDWTVSTLFFFYLVFPMMLVLARKRTSKQLLIGMIIAYFFQYLLAIICASFLPMQDEVLLVQWFGYWVAIAHPLTRLPVFFMGISAGILCNRLRQKDTDQDHALRPVFGTFGTFIMDNFYLSNLAALSCKKLKTNETSKDELQKFWKKRVDLNFGFYCALIALFIGIQVLFKHDSNYVKFIEDLKSKNETVPVYITAFKDGWPAFLMQIYCILPQLMIIIGLCLDGGQSWTSSFFRTKVMQFLGRISMALYLSHVPLMQWMKFALNGGPSWPYDENGNRTGWITFPLWAILPHFVITVIFASLLTFYIEEPIKKKYHAKYDLK